MRILPQERLILLVGAPRSGTTLLTRMLAAHPGVHARPEPHLLTPLAHLGYYDRVDAAPFDVLQASGALRQLVADLPRGEQDYLDAVRAYALTIYGRLTPSGLRFLDKTPANALVLPFLARAFPSAKFVVLTRDPCAVHDSYVTSFFDGHDADALAFNPILRRYVPAIATFLREATVQHVHVRYRELVSDPEAQLARVQRFLQLPEDISGVDYGTVAPGLGEGLGDPVTVDRLQRPSTASLGAWRASLAARPGAVELLQAELLALDERDLLAWGHPREELLAALRELPPGRRRTMPRDRYQLQRKLILWLRRDIHRRPHGRWVRRVRDVCDVLLRGGSGGWGDRPFGRR